MSINWNIIGSRFAAAALTALVPATAHGTLPITLGTALSLTAGAVISIAPSAFAAAGILRPVSPGELSVAQQVGKAITALISAPEAQRAALLAEDRRKLEAAAIQAGERAGEAAAMKYLEKTGGFTKDQLGAVDQTSTAAPAPSFTNGGGQ